MNDEERPDYETWKNSRVRKRKRNRETRVYDLGKFLKERRGGGERWRNTLNWYSEVF